MLIYAILCQFTMSITNTVLPLYVINGLGHGPPPRAACWAPLSPSAVSAAALWPAISVTALAGVSRWCWAAGIVALALFMLGFQATLIMLLVFKVIQGIGHALNSTTSNAVAAEVLPRDKVGRALAITPCIPC